MVPGYSGAVGDVPPPPTPYYDPDFELMFPETLQCGHSSRSVLDNCESCLACNAVYAALMKNRERVSFRNGLRRVRVQLTGQETEEPVLQVRSEGRAEKEDEVSRFPARRMLPDQEASTLSTDRGIIHAGEKRI